MNTLVLWLPQQPIGALHLPTAGDRAGQWPAIL